MRILFLTGLFIITATGCKQKSPEYIFNEGKIFGTYYHIVYQSVSGDKHQQIKDLLNSFNKSLSTYDTGSIISRFNRGEKNVAADSFFVKVFNTAIEVYEKSSGAFDITVAPLVNAWGFGFSKIEKVTPCLIDSLIQYVGMSNVSINNGIITKKKDGIMLDASAIAKGYGVDVVALFLKNQGIKNYMVEIGGEINSSGLNPKGKLWRIGIDKPIDDPLVESRELQMIIQISDKSMATSGNYRNFYIKDGKKFAHTIDPSTGYPVQHSLLSATIIADDCMTADAYATACMVLGLEKSIELIEQLPGVEGCFIFQDDTAMNVVYTSGFEGYIDKPG